MSIVCLQQSSEYKALGHLTIRPHWSYSSYYINGESALLRGVLDSVFVLCRDTEHAAQASDEILAAFREIPSYGLAHGDMLKAYLILSGDNGCRVRSLLRLPKNLRKDWLLMEIKADDAY